MPTKATTTQRAAATSDDTLSRIGELAIAAHRTERALSEAERGGVMPQGRDGTRELRSRRDAARVALSAAIAAFIVAE